MIKGDQGREGGRRPGEGQNRVFCCFWQRGVSATRCFLLDQKILFLAEVVEFWNLENTGRPLKLKYKFSKIVSGQKLIKNTTDNFQKLMFWL